jgi:hypothetical protein
VARYSEFLGCKVTVRYRVGEMLLSATGTFSADSGRSIFLEQHLEQRGGRKYFRWEIPYPYIYRIQAEASVEQEGAAVAKRAVDSSDSPPKAAAAAAGESSGGATSFSPFLNAPTPLD